MRRTFLTALLLAAIAAVVFAPSAMTKKEPPTPPPAPSGTFVLGPGSTISLTNMNLLSQQALVMVGVCVGDVLSNPYCVELGFNDPNAEVQIADWSYTNETPSSVPVRLVLVDGAAEVVYLSDGTFLVTSGGGIQEGSHATLGWGEEDQILLSINDGSQHTLEAWQPALGEGNFNATIGITVREWPVTITNITGYSDGATVDESNTPMCGFHAVITYTMRKDLKKKVTATGTTVLFTPPSEGVGYATASLDASPFDPGTFNVLPTNLRADVDYQFMAVIDDDTSTNDWLGMQASAIFRLDPTTFVDGCPAPGQIISTNFG